jgi:hypothetical protein
VENATDYGGNRAGNAVAATGVGDFFTSHTVFLGIESKRTVGSGLEVPEGTGQRVEGRLANRKSNVPEKDWGSVGSVAVFARSKEKEEGNPGEVCDGAAQFIGNQGRAGLGVVEDGDWEGFDPCRCGVNFRPRTEQGT